MGNNDQLYMRVGRVRSIKPEFFKSEKLFDLEKETGLPIRLAFAGLWTQSDREGRFMWRPRMLKSYILPYDDSVDFSRVLDALATRGTVVKYENHGELYGFIPSWNRHQSVNNREKDSLIPAPSEEQIAAARKQLTLPLLNVMSSTRESRVTDATGTESHSRKAEGKGREGIGKDKVKTTGTLGRASRLPDSFRVTDEHRKFARDHNLPDPDQHLAEFRDYWIGVAGAKGTKLNWDATFRNWLRNAERFGTKKNNARPSTPKSFTQPVSAEIPWSEKSQGEKNAFVNLWTRDVRGGWEKMSDEERGKRVRLLVENYPFVLPEQWPKWMQPHLAASKKARA